VTEQVRVLSGLGGGRSLAQRLRGVVGGGYGGRRSERMIEREMELGVDAIFF
jgi:hypothetical protein